MGFRVAILFLALTLSGCARFLEERRFVDWRLEDDLAAFREQGLGNPEQLYRVDELSGLLQSAPYQRFLELVSEAPSGERAFIYYEVSAANGVWFFALGVDGRSCRVMTSEYDGVHERSCDGFSTFTARTAEARSAVRDGLVAGLVQYEPGREPTRTMALVETEQSGIPSDGDLPGKVRRVFSNGQGR